MKIVYRSAAIAGIAFFCGVVVAGFTLLPSLAAVNEGLTCLLADCEDLAAQRSMATAAWVMAGLTFVATIVGAASLALIASTLDAAKRSAKAAENAADHAANALGVAERSLEVSRRMGVAQTRSYVTVSEVEAQYGGRGTLIWVTLKNSGATPARIANLHLDARLEKETTEGSTSEIVPVPTPKVFLPDIAAGDDETVHFGVSMLFNSDLWDFVNAHRLRIKITGDLQYRDVFGEPHPYVFGFEGKPTLGASGAVRFRLERMPAIDTEGPDWV